MTHFLLGFGAACLLAAGIIVVLNGVHENEAARHEARMRKRLAYYSECMDDECGTCYGTGCGDCRDEDRGSER